MLSVCVPLVVAAVPIPDPRMYERLQVFCTHRTVSYYSTVTVRQFPTRMGVENSKSILRGMNDIIGSDQIEKIDLHQSTTKTPKSLDRP